MRVCVHVWWAFNVCCVEQLGVTKILHHLRWPWNQRHLLIRFIQTVFFFIFFIGVSIFAKLIFSTPWHGDWFSDIRTNVDLISAKHRTIQIGLRSKSGGFGNIDHSTVRVFEPMFECVPASKCSITISITFKQDQKYGFIYLLIHEMVQLKKLSVKVKKDRIYPW